METPFSGSPTELIDYASGVTPKALSYAARFTHGSVTVSRCVLHPNGGVRMGSPQLTVAIHEGTPIELEWCSADGKALQRRRFGSGEVHIFPADSLTYKRWTGTGRILHIALDRLFVEQTTAEAFEGRCPDLRSLLGTRDTIIESMAPVWAQELAETGAAGRLFSEGLGVALAVHLFRTYGDHSVPLRPIKGGLGANRQRRVIDYIETNLTEDMSLAGLADVAGLSRNHFADAFRESTGTPAYRYLIERRIERAKALLLASDRPIAEIALAVGFATHSHFTFNFRKVMGTTPSRFRLDRA